MPPPPASRVFGVGVDVAHVPRFRRTLARFGERFLRRALHPAEAVELRARRPEDRAAFLASRWAVKEAAFKAFHGHRVLFPEMRVTKGSIRARETHPALPEVATNSPERALRLDLSGEAARRAQELRLAEPHVSLSHDGDYAVAYVVLEQLTTDDQP